MNNSPSVIENQNNSSGAIRTDPAVIPHDNAVASQVEAIVSVIERAATNPAVDIDKMERLLQMQERVMARQAETEFALAMSTAQTEVPQVAPNKTNSQTHSRYADYGALDAVLRPVYTRHGFALSYDTTSPAPEVVTVICYVSHIGGHTRTYSIDMPSDGKGAKGNDVMTKTHATGSATSYGMRYLLKMIFNVAVSIAEDDDDGNAAGGAPAAGRNLEVYPFGKNKGKKWSELEDDFLVWVLSNMDDKPDILDAARAELDRRNQADAAAAAPQTPEPAPAHLNPHTHCTYKKNAGKAWADMSDRQLMWYAGIGEGAKDPADKDAVKVWEKRQDDLAALNNDQQNADGFDPELGF